MAAIQCKMCGGMVELVENATCGECPYCGSLTTFPRISSNQTEHLYGRAEHFRQRGDFDKAAAAYEKILEENPEDPEACWGLLISRYGIEYVEDPVSHERIPTCHRVQQESILADPDYLNVLQYSKGLDHDIYEKEAQRIAAIQKEILAVSAQEKPYDVFICYKETADDETRTQDSVLAQDIYYQLTNAGYRVFFSRISLENKLGQQYEPFIFAALNSAKVMLAIGSRKEYFESVWVRNEWSRFLALMKKDRGKLLIPCYMDMSAYDLPEELSMLQSQDMRKIGFMQDILHGVKKILENFANPKQDPVSGSGSAVSAQDDLITNLLKRAKICVEDREWDMAAACCEKVFERDPENADAYFYKCLISHQISSTNFLLKTQILNDDHNFRRALQFNPEKYKPLLEQQKNMFRQRDKGRYEAALALMKQRKYTEAIAKFRTCIKYADAREKIKECEQNVDNGIGCGCAVALILLAAGITTCFYHKYCGYGLIFLALVTFTWAVSASTKSHEKQNPQSGNRTSQ